MRLFIFILTFIVSVFSYAQSQPKIGLVLSGGGAKGAAHIGVLKVIEKNNIPINYIAGTSIGAYVGGLYALGYRVAEIEKIMLNLPWDDSYSDFIPRVLLSFNNKELNDQYNIALRLGFSDGKFKSPSGLLLGQSAGSLLKYSTDVVAKFDSFDHLAIPYRAVASDLVSAKAVVLDKGSITQAMRASAAVPGVVEPVTIDGKLLVDGGITNNMPVDVVKAMGADIVIAVDIGSPLLVKEEINDTIDVINQLSTILTDKTTLAQKRYLSNRDILIRPKIDKLSTTDFSIMEQALELGVQAALLVEPELKKLSVNAQAYLSYQQKKGQKKQQKSLNSLHDKPWFKAFSQPIVDIEYQNYSRTSTAVIREKLALQVGDTVTKEQLKLAVERVYATDKFEYVDAEFVDTAEGRKLVIMTKAKSWGPNYLNFGFSAESDFTHKSTIDIDVAYIQSDISPYGGMWLNEMKLGLESVLLSEWYQPLDEVQHYFARANIKFARDIWGSMRDRSQLTNKYFQTKLGTGYNYSNDGAIEIGFIGEKGEIAFQDDRRASLDYDSLGAYFTFDYDSLNSINFPTQGQKISVDVFWRNDNYQAAVGIPPKDKSVVINLDWRGAFHIKNHAFVGLSSFSTTSSDADFSIHITDLGGFLNLSGYQKDALIGYHKAFAAVMYQYDLGREFFNSANSPLYLGVSLEAGNVWNIKDEIKFNDLISAGSVYLGTDTNFGPAVFGVGFAAGGKKAVFLSLGKTF